MSFGVVDTHHAAADLNRTNDGWVFLVTVLSLRFLLLSLPESVPAQGMLGLVQGQVLTEGQIFRSITAVLLLWACLKGAGSLVHFARLLPSFVSNTKRILRRTSLLRRQVGVALVGFCLLWIDGSWIALWLLRSSVAVHTRCETIPGSLHLSTLRPALGNQSLLAFSDRRGKLDLPQGLDDLRRSSDFRTGNGGCSVVSTPASPQPQLLFCGRQENAPGLLRTTPLDESAGASLDGGSSCLATDPPNHRQPGLVLRYPPPFSIRSECMPQVGRVGRMLKE